MTELITTKEAASILNRAPLTVKKYIQRGKLFPTQKIGGKNFFDKEKILSFKRTLSSTKSSFKRGIRQANFKTKASHGLPEAEMMAIIEKWQINSRDTSSADVEIGVYTEKIMRLEVKLRQIPTEHPDFKNMRYKLLWHVGERRKLLHYLEISNYGRYRKAIAILEKEGRFA